jgi:hypothetical protein
MKSDMRSGFADVLNKQFAEMKSINTGLGGNGSTDKVMVPIYVDPKIIDQSRKQTPLTEIIPRVTNQGRTADYNSISAKGSAFFGAEGGPMTFNDPTPARGSTAIKYLYATGLVTGPAQATIPGYTLAGFQPQGNQLPGVGSFSNVAAANANNFAVQLAARAMKELEENTIINEHN